MLVHELFSEVKDLFPNATELELFGASINLRTGDVTVGGITKRWPETIEQIKEMPCNSLT